MTGAIHIFTDGGSRGNPGPGASAFVATRDHSLRPSRDNVVYKRGEFQGICTNNEAEYGAVIMALVWAQSRGHKDLVIHSDSQLLVKQLLGEYRVKAPKLKPLFERATFLLKKVNWKAVHHRREHPWIELCDSLVNDTLDDRRR